MKHYRTGWYCRLQVQLHVALCNTQTSRAQAAHSMCDHVAKSAKPRLKMWRQRVSIRTDYPDRLDRN